MSLWIAYLARLLVALPAFALSVQATQHSGELRGEFGREVSSCRCLGGPKPTGHCGFHDGLLLSMAAVPWCRTNFGCGFASWFGSWSHCDPRGVERRRAADGQLHTVAEFQQHYGKGRQEQWRNAGAFAERRVARNKQAYTIRDFRNYCVDSLGEEGWLAEWLAANPESRVARDGLPYTWEDFSMYYGPARARVMWTVASIAVQEEQQGSSGSQLQESQPHPQRTSQEGGRSAPSSQESSAQLVLLSEAQHPTARCLDGSMAGYYLRRGSRLERYLLFLEGGGWCYDADCRKPSREGTLSDCERRSRGRLGSSKGWPRSKGPGGMAGMLSPTSLENPVFHNWTLIFVPYCDGTSFSGNSTVQGLHFRGSSILHAVAADLKGMISGRVAATKVVFSGGSAGALAVFYHADQMAEQLQLAPGSFLALPDGGFFLDMPDKEGTDCWPAQMRSLFEVAGGYGSLHATCLKRFPGDQRSKCLFPEHFLDLLRTPTLAIHSLYDSSELTYTLGLSCCPGGCGGTYPSCSKKDMGLATSLRQRHITSMKALARSNSRSGVWASACIGHVLASSQKWTDSSWEVPPRSGNTMAAAVQRWLLGGHQDEFAHIDELPVSPEGRPCTGSW